MKSNHCNTGLADGSKFCPDYGTQNSSLRKCLLAWPLIVLLIGAGVWSSCSGGHAAKENAGADSTAVDSTAVNEAKATPVEDADKDATPNPFVGKTYTGGGNGGGLGTDMTISFLENNKCICESDWYRAYSSPKKFQGEYSVEGDKLIVRCNGEDGTKYEFKFDVKSNGRVIEFDNSVPGEGSMGNDYMSLELQASLKGYYRCTTDDVNIYKGPGTNTGKVMLEGFCEGEGVAQLGKGGVVESDGKVKNGFIHVKECFAGSCWQEGWVEKRFLEKATKCSKCKGTGKTGRPCPQCKGQPADGCCNWTGKELCPECFGIGYR